MPYTPRLPFSPPMAGELHQSPQYWNSSRRSASKAANQLNMRLPRPLLDARWGKNQMLRKRVVLTGTLAIPALVAVCAGVLAQGHVETEKSNIPALIEQLGHPDFRAREQASRTLAEIGLRDYNNRGWRLFLTSTRDGIRWSTLRLIAIDGSPVGFPPGALQLLQGPDGKCRVFRRGLAGAAESPAKLRELRPAPLGKGQQDWHHRRNPHVTVDSGGLFHMVFQDRQGAIRRATSRDGLDYWSVPALLLTAKDGHSGDNPQLILARGKAALLYERNDGAYITPIRFPARPVESGTGIKITNHVIPLCGSRVTITKGGEVLLTAGSDTSWLLRAKVDELLRRVCE